MVSTKSLFYFVTINLIFTGLGTLDYYIYLNYSIYTLLVSILFKNIGIPIFLVYTSRSDPYIIEGSRNTDIIDISNVTHIVYTSLFEFTSTYILLYFVLSSHSVSSELLFFIPNTFFLEVLFDLFHYISHRFLHSVPFLYKRIHKYHHQSHTISILTTFHHTTVDLILSNLLPLVCTFLLYPIHKWTFFTWLWYKSLIEMGGHSGKNGKSSSFPQCIWIPKILGIEMYPQDHNMHHLQNNVNFSKRFTFWDKIFKTFRNGSTSSNEWILSNKSRP